jgi:multiple sugar transport system ATP-binding protein
VLRLGRSDVPEIVLENVEKSYGSVRVLPPINLALKDGEFTVLVGPSGCGKSTTLRILAGLESLSSGEIFFDGRPVSQLEPRDRDIAMVFQDYALYPHMNIARNMSFALRLARRPKAEIDAKVNRVASMLNIGHLLERKPAELSGGQRQRVAMGRALVRDASTFLFDEPLSNLDAKLRAKMRTELAEMRNMFEKSMVYVTHDQVEAMTLGDRIVVMNEGVVQQQGTPEELFKHPVNKFVAGFIGSPAMKFIEGELVEEKGRLWVRGAGHLLPLGLGASVDRKGEASREVTVGIRPSSFRLGHALGAPIEVRVVVTEYLGAQSVLATRLSGGDELLIETTSTTPTHAGSQITVGVIPEEIMVFDRATGKTL